MQATGQCYCGAFRLSGTATSTVAYCHCKDCKRWTGAPLPAFAAFETDQLHLSAPCEEVLHPSGVARRNCPKCGSPLTARFPYLPGQVYVPLGLLDTADQMPPTLHCHAGSALPWLHMDDDLPREDGTGTDILLEATT